MTDLQFNVHGLRTFRVSDDGNLLPVTAVDDSWRDGVCIARCRRRPHHRAPVENCRCGIYTFRTLSVLRGQYAPADLLVAVIALEGQTLAGSRGWRSQAGRVVALWIAPGALSDDLLIMLAGNLPEVQIFQDVEKMLAHYPDLSSADPDLPSVATEMSVPPRPQLARGQARMPLRRNKVRIGLLPLYGLLTAFVCWILISAENDSVRPAAPASPAAADNPLQGAIADFGRFLAAHDQVLAVPLLLVGLGIYARSTGSVAAKWLSLAVRILIPLVVAAVIAALISGNRVEVSPLMVTIVLLLWGHTHVLLAEVSNTEGPGSVLARKIIMKRTARATSIAGDGRSPGVAYQLHPDHSPRSYPLTIPVHFEPRGS